MRQFMLFSLGCSLFVLFGCGSQSTPTGGSDPAQITEATEAEATEGQTVTLTDEDKALIEEQMFCPSGGKLGSMGTPVKIMVEGKPIFLCCEHCKDAVLDDPAAAFAAIEKKKQEAAEKAAEETPESSEKPSPETGETQNEIST